MTKIILVILLMKVAASASNIARLQNSHETNHDAAVDAPFARLELEEAPLFAKIETFEKEPLFEELEPVGLIDEELVAELDLYKEEERPETTDEEEDENDEDVEDLIPQGGRRHRNRHKHGQRHRHGHKQRRGRQEKSALARLHTGDEDNKRSRRIQGSNGKDIDMRGERRRRRRGRKNGATKISRVGKRGDRKQEGAAGGCERRSRICCDGSAPAWKRSPRGRTRKMICNDGERPVCSMDKCDFSLLEYFATMI